MAPGDVEDVSATRELVLDELDRMGRLVDDLVVLARAGRPDFLRARPIDLGSLTDDVLDKARGLGDRRWQCDARAEAELVADPQRLTQALLQLASNAVSYTDRGAEIAIGTSVASGTASLWVRDTGHGVDPADAERIFDRFERGDGADPHRRLRRAESGPARNERSALPSRWSLLTEGITGQASDCRSCGRSPPRTGAA